MKKLFMGLVLVSGFAQAQDLAVTVKNFNFTYQNARGEGSAASFYVTPRNPENNVKVLVEKFGKDFQLTVTGSAVEQYELKDAPSFMAEAERMTVTNFNLSLADNLTASLTQGRFQSPKDELKLDGLTLDCARVTAHKEVMDQLISGCIQRMNLRSSKFSTSSAEESLAHIVSHSIASAMNEGRAMSGVGVNSVELKTNGGKYDLSAEVKAQVSGKVKSNGNMSYDATTGKLTLRISEVKFSFLNITGKVFEELRKQESEKLQVKEPFVYYTIK